MTKGYIKKGLQVLVDIYLFNMAFILALLIRFEGYVPRSWIDLYLENFIWLTAVFIITCFIFRLYNRLWSYSSIHDLIVLFTAITIGVASTFGLSAIIGAVLPRSIYFIAWFLCLLLLGGFRLGFRVLKLYNMPALLSSNKGRSKNISANKKNAKNALILGAGDAGSISLKELSRHQDEVPINVVGFLDDAPAKQNCWINGVKVLGKISDLEKVCNKHGVEEVIIAMPNAPRTIVRDIIRTCSDNNIKAKILPPVHHLISGRVTVSSMREVNIEDLLRREPVDLNIDEISGYIKGKIIMVTGAGGSIGSELVRQIIEFDPEKLILIDHSENSLFDIQRELETHQHKDKLLTMIADIQDKARINSIFENLKPQVVFHAAAHKHVPLMENNPEEAVKNNIFGTQNVAEAADTYKAERFVLISTDKAVNPKSAMGATKRAAEIIVQSLATRSDTSFCAVRFGNVLGSRSSVVPLFQEQIKKGGPVTITHPDMTRYFMTIPEACQLVIEAGSMGKKGEIFILDMGEPIKILDLAKDLIKLSGYEPEVDIPITVTGIREGEKIHEELLTNREEVTNTTHERIYITDNDTLDLKDIKQELKELGEITSYDLSFLAKKLENWIDSHEIRSN
ncbi:polysaccharide biosynthesis protein [Natranaerofaba carboxydovora]|uniref:polysaccharide biosynthesis protein n=1 Tax=Natranaerofaba carboxydovora TaxID=2742683 RepID=UPI001F147074|nr:nucleoside-diphosphate sugar epimerase/dehydratase [Natranaerofaba carboxydovora]UMZ74701.1 UDP-N-acetyl-alpha-D-glucosamine C6 dehydratase [Natranaerofaba carboxydovora]